MRNIVDKKLRSLMTSSDELPLSALKFPKINGRKGV